MTDWFYVLWFGLTVLVVLLALLVMNLTYALIILAVLTGFAGMLYAHDRR